MGFKGFLACAGDIPATHTSSYLETLGLWVKQHVNFIWNHICSCMDLPEMKIFHYSVTSKRHLYHSQYKFLWHKNFKVFNQPIQNAANKGRDESDSSLSTSHCLAKTKQQGQVTMDSMLLLQNSVNIKLSINSWMMWISWNIKIFLIFAQHLWGRVALQYNQNIPRAIDSEVCDHNDGTVLH